MRTIRSLYFQVVVAIAIGVLVGIFWPSVGTSLKPLGDGFIKLIKMVIAPVVFCTVTAGISHMGDMRRFGRVGLKALVYFEVVSTFALVLGLVVGTVVGPGRGFTAGAAALNDPAIAGYIQKAGGQSVSSYLLGLIPDSFFSPFANGELLQVVFIAILTGFALTLLGDFGKAASVRLDQLSKVFFKIIQIIVRLAPIGAFGSMAFTVGKFGVASLTKLASLVATFYLTSILFVLVVLGLVAYLAGFSILKFINYIKEELLVVLGTSSSESVLPQLMEKLENAGVSKPVVGVVVPTGYSFNLDGTNIYMTLATLFLAQATNTPLSFAQILTLLLIAMLTSKGASGVTGAGFITLAATLAAVPTIPVASLALLVGVDRFMSECRALTNTVGNGVASIVVAKWDRELNYAKLTRALQGASRELEAVAGQPGPPPPDLKT